MAYAQNTKVPVERSRAEVERTLVKFGATKFFSGWDDRVLSIGFVARNRTIRMTVATPPIEPSSKRRYGADKRDQEIRRLWRALLLAIKAKIEIIDSGISTFEQEFLPYTVLPDGKTVADQVEPLVAKAIETGKTVPLLLGDGR